MFDDQCVEPDATCLRRGVPYSETPVRARGCFILCSLGWLLAGGCLLYSAIFQAPASDEFGHFYAGLRYWQLGDLETFNVNPPLLRSICTFPAYLTGMGQEAADDSLRRDRMSRPEFSNGRKLFCTAPARFQYWLSMGRLFVVATTMAGGMLLFRWGKQLAGDTAGWLAAGMWFAQPQILSHGVLITGDVYCAVWMMVAIRVLVWTTEHLSAKRAIALGATVGMAVLAKFTALVLLPILLYAFAWQADRYRLHRLIGCLLIVGITLVLVVSLPYGFAGWGKDLRDYEFLSKSMSDPQSKYQFWRESLPWLRFPVPLPEQLVLGIDRQQLDFERGLPSYAAGLRAPHGWWWFYLYSMLVKLPSGTWIAIAATIYLLVAKRNAISRGLALPLALFAGMLAVTAAQDGFAQQHRYVLPAYPPLFLVIGVVAARGLQLDGRAGKRAGRVVQIGFAASLIASCWVAPHWLSSFNWPAGGSRSGYKCLFNDASDWGQDTYRVRDWIVQHQGGIPIYVRSSYSGHAQLAAVGAEFREFPNDWNDLERGCWIVVSKSNLVIDNRMARFLSSIPIHGQIADSHLVYFVGVDP
ncbi:MAG: glycosyltransferase family 39 protein [Planctomycetales bacterium]|nr:glycosyltransferase family 39 protein [Planctomycetales bacterium]